VNRYRIVVLEGPDGSGKTTLARALEADLGYVVRHEGPPPADLEDVFEYYAGKLTLAAFEAMSTGVVLDRFALGERVYGPLLRGRDRLGDSGWAAMHSCLDACGAFRVLCLPPYHRALETWQSRQLEGREFITSEETFFRTWMEWRTWDLDRGQVTYDWTDESAYSRLVSVIRG
jgi:hypothetical protein